MGSKTALVGASLALACAVVSAGPASADPVCHCISSCAATASPAAPTDGRVLVVAISRVIVNASLGTTLPARQLPLDLLPPSTAPPLTPQSLA